MSSGQLGSGARMVVAMSDNAAVAVVERTPVMELAAKAAEQIRTRGWHQGTLGSSPRRPESCSVCLLGAANAATGSNDPWNAAYGWLHAVYQFEDAVAKHLGFESVYSVVNWNDAPGRTVDEVLAVLDAVSEGH